MASSIRVLEDELVEELEGEATPQPVTELPVREPFDGNNRRFVPRVRGSFNARSASGDLMGGVDLSFGGMLCLSEQPLWPGNRIDLELHLSGARHAVPVSGRVVELVSLRGEIAMRIRFSGVEHAARRAIASWMADNVGHGPVRG